MSSLFDGLIIDAAIAGWNRCYYNSQGIHDFLLVFYSDIRSMSSYAHDARHRAN